MAIRFANGMFEPIWRRDFVDHVQITAAETIGVEERGAFYEPTGALRDMVPNHLFQLLCMTAMEPPVSFDAEAVRTEKAKLVQAVRRSSPRMRCAASTAPAPSRAAPSRPTGTSRTSRATAATETYAALKLTIDNWRWGGVPFYLRTGKRMTGRRTEIAVHFKPAPYRLFRDTPVDQIAPNILRIMVDPVQGMTTEFNAKVPGPSMRLGAVRSTFREGDFFPRSRMSATRP